MRQFNKWFGPDVFYARLAFLTATLLALMSLRARCEEPAVRWDLYTGSQRLFKPGSDATALAFSRLYADAAVVKSGRAYAWVQASKTFDGGANPDLTDPHSWENAEVYLGYRHGGLVSGTAFFGYSVPIEKGVVAAARFPRVYGAGAIVGDSRQRYLMVAVGQHEASGSGVKTLFMGSWPVKGAVCAVVDGAVGGDKSFVRAGLAVRVGD